MTSVRELTYEERATWGECPVCGAPHGEFCNPDIGFPVGRGLDGFPIPGGTHIGRLRRAPRRVKEVPCE